MLSPEILVAIYSHLLPGIAPGQFYDTPESYMTYDQSAGFCIPYSSYINMETAMALFWKAKTIQWEGTGSYVQGCYDFSTYEVNMDFYGTSTAPAPDPCNTSFWSRIRNFYFSQTASGGCDGGTATFQAVCSLQRVYMCQNRDQIHLSWLLQGQDIYPASPEEGLGVLSIGWSSALGVPYQTWSGYTVAQGGYFSYSGAVNIRGTVTEMY